MPILTDHQMVLLFAGIVALCIGAGIWLYSELQKNKD